MTALITLIRPLIPYFIGKDSRNGLLLILVAIIFSWWLVGYVDKKHEEVKVEMQSMDKEFRAVVKEENQAVIQEVRDIRSDLQMLYRTIIVNRRSR